MTRTLAVPQMIAIARAVRSGLLGRRGVPRDLAGQCGLAAMLVAVELADLRVLRTGFYMKISTFCGRRARYPHRHAWCQVDGTIVDPTATQFSRGHRAVHVTRVREDDRYVETADADDAVDDIMTNWHGRELPEYAALARSLCA